LFGAKLTAADYAVYPGVFLGKGAVEAAEELGQYSKLTAWLAQVADQKGQKATNAMELPVLPAPA